MSKKDKSISTVKAGTKSVWGGQERPSFEGATQVPVVLSVTYGYETLDEWHEVALGKRQGHIYSRNTNPTVAAFEEKVRLLENAEAATSFSTGMAAISNSLHALLQQGDRVVSIKDSYGGTSLLFLEFLPRFGIECCLCETDDAEAIEREIRRGCQIVYLESPTNPTLKVIDLKRIAEAARKMGALTIVDNTFATPLNQQPLELGADLVLHSATKFLGGHSDAMGGVVCGKKELIDRIFRYREINGASLDAHSAYLLLRGMQTLELRVNRQNENALQLARFLENCTQVDSVFYPGLPSHTGQAIARRQMSGYGGVLAFDLKGGYDSAKAFLERLRWAHKAASLGSVSTLVGPPRVTSHVEATAEERARLGIPEGLIRCSVGIENIEDIIRDFEQALGF